jgi:predicted N-acetyltransferase YhbS
MSNQVAVSPLGPERADDVRRLDQLAFAFGADDVNADFLTAALEWDRVFGATVDADPELAGIYAVYSLGLSVPTGGWGAAVAPVPMAGVSWVAVHPGRRRRGVASAMIRHHLHGVHESGGEAVSGLHASEPAIYGRFGYGLATSGHRLTVARGGGHAAVAGAPGSHRVHTLTEAAHRAGHRADEQRLTGGRLSAAAGVFAVASSSTGGRQSGPRAVAVVSRRGGGHRLCAAAPRGALNGAPPRAPPRRRAGGAGRRDARALLGVRHEPRPRRHRADAINRR